MLGYPKADIRLIKLLGTEEVDRVKDGTAVVTFEVDWVVAVIGVVVMEVVPRICSYWGTGNNNGC